MELQGHRGARGLFPENTVAGFVATCRLGVDSVELDVAVTADGVVVVSHDPTLDPDLTRGADGAWLDGAPPVIRTLTLAALRRFDVGRLRPGSRTALLFPAQIAVDGARVPTMQEVFQATGETLIDAELKTLPDRPTLTVTPEAMADALLAAAESADAMGRLRVRSFDWRGLAYLRRIRPEVPLVWLTRPGDSTAPGPWWCLPGHRGPAYEAVATVAAGAPWRAGWAPHINGLTIDDIRQARGLGLAVMPWTANSEEDLGRLIDWGVDGLCTDRPDIARRVMARRGLPLPAGNV